MLVAMATPISTHVKDNKIVSSLRVMIEDIIFLVKEIKIVRFCFDSGISYVSFKYFNFRRSLSFLLVWEKKIYLHRVIPCVPCSYPFAT